MSSASQISGMKDEGYEDRTHRRGAVGDALLQDDPQGDGSHHRWGSGDDERHRGGGEGDGLRSDCAEDDGIHRSDGKDGGDHRDGAGGAYPRGMRHGEWGSEAAC